MIYIGDIFQRPIKPLQYNGTTETIEVLGFINVETVEVKLSRSDTCEVYTMYYAIASIESEGNRWKRINELEDPAQLVPLERLERFIGATCPTNDELHDMAVELINLRAAYDKLKSNMRDARNEATDLRIRNEGLRGIIDNYRDRLTRIHTDSTL